MQRKYLEEQSCASASSATRRGYRKHEGHIGGEHTRSRAGTAVPLVRGWARSSDGHFHHQARAVAHQQQVTTTFVLVLRVGRVELIHVHGEVEAHLTREAEEDRELGDSESMAVQIVSSLQHVHQALKHADGDEIEKQFIPLRIAHVHVMRSDQNSRP